MLTFLLTLGLLSIPPCFPCCNASFPYSRVYRPMPHAVCRTLPFLLELLAVIRRERGKLRGASDNMRRSMGKKRYNAGNRAGYSATLDAAGMAALNPRASGNGSMEPLSNLKWRTSSRCKQACAWRSAPLSVGFMIGDL